MFAMRVATAMLDSAQFSMCKLFAVPGSSPSCQRVKLITLFLVALVLFECCHMPLVEAGSKGRDIIIYDGKVILKGGKKKGNIIISNGSHGQGKYKYKKKYMDYGGYW